MHIPILTMLEFMMLDPGFTVDQLLPDSYASINEYRLGQSKLFFGEEESV